MSDKSSHFNPNPRADSAGVPWDGRQFETNPWQGDDGSANPAVIEALNAISNRDATVAQLISALSGTRLLVPLLATLGESELGPNGQLVDKSAELSVVAVATPDGASAIPAFTDVAAMRSWNHEARPVPVAAEIVALAAVGEGHTRVIVNPATDRVALRHPHLKALASKTIWTNPATDQQAIAAIQRVLASHSQVTSHSVSYADQFGTLSTPEIEIEIHLKPGLNQLELDALLGAIGQGFTHESDLEGVDSFSFKIVSAVTS